MKLLHWLKLERGRAKWLAAKLDVSQATVSDWASGKKAVPVDRATALEQATGADVMRWDLRDDWRSHWPELQALAARAPRVPDIPQASPAQPLLPGLVR